MRKIYKSLILVFISILTPNVQAIEVGGIISEDTTWSITNEPYIITTPIQIAWGKTLTINPGVTVKNGEIRVFGNLQARGTSLNKIVFNNVSIKPDFDGDWTAVKNHFIAISHSNIIGGSIYAATGNAINGTLLLEDSVVDGVKEGIYLWYPTSNASIQRNIFKNIDSEYNDDSFIYAILSDNSVHVQKNITLRIYDNYFDSSVDLPIIAYTQENASIWIFGNTFPRVQRNLIKLERNSNGNVYAYQNYWGTTIEREISSMIYDRYDDLSIQYEIKYNNYLSEPSPFAPDPPAITSHPSSLTVNSGQSATFSVTASGRNVTYQWMNNGLPVSGATSPVYTINSAQPINGGQISVLVSNWDGTANSNAATFTVITPAPPSVTSQPLAAQILNAGSAASLSVSASGTALTYQWYQGARGDTSNPVGGNSSSFTTPLLATNSSYWVRVSNTGGSVDSSESVIVVWPQGIRVGDQFSADLGPLASGGKTLKLAGKLPAGLSLNTKTWQVSGTVTGNAGNFTPSIQVIQNKAVLQNISIPILVGNFPTSLIGNYEALLKGQNGAPFGVFKLTTGKNVWTASLETLGQARRTAKGVFALQQGSSSASFEVKFAATKTAPALTLNFTLDGDSPFLFGSHNTGTVEGFKMIDSLATATNPILYNLIMDQGTVDALDKPAGKGWASGSFARTGIGTFKGMLGDATACSFPLRLSVTGQAILWAQPYANKNSFIGGVVDMSDLVPNADSDEALESKISWVKVADSKTLSYPNGFSFDDLSISGSRWIVPTSHTALGNSLGWLGGEKCTLRIYGAGLSNESQQSAVAVKFPTEFTLDNAYKLIAPINASTLKWTGSVVKGTGAFSGSFTIPAGLAANTIAGSGTVSGLLLQDDTWGTTTGLGLIKMPISGAKGSFRTAAVTLEQ